MLLDCGEGTYGQLYRRFCDQEADMSSFLTQLKCIFISHLHADHHLGLIRILVERSKVSHAMTLFPCSLLTQLDLLASQFADTQNHRP